MFAQVNSEHCRHKIFNSNFVVNGKLNKTPFELIKETFKNNSLVLRKHTMITQRF